MGKIRVREEMGSGYSERPPETNRAESELELIHSLEDFFANNPWTADLARGDRLFFAGTVREEARKRWPGPKRVRGTLTLHRLEPVGSESYFSINYTEGEEACLVGAVASDGTSATIQGAAAEKTLRDARRLLDTEKPMLFRLDLTVDDYPFFGLGLVK